MSRVADIWKGSAAVFTAPACLVTSFAVVDCDVSATNSVDVFNVWCSCLMLTCVPYCSYVYRYVS